MFEKRQYIYNKYVVVYIFTNEVVISVSELLLSNCTNVSYGHIYRRIAAKLKKLILFNTKISRVAATVVIKSDQKGKRLVLLSPIFPFEFLESG